jgi:hypothetical protein
MNLTETLHDRLAESLADRLADGDLGCCLRVDYLSADDASRVCAKLRDLLVGRNAAAFVLSMDPRTDYEVSAERAIELRNRKQVALCVLVPVGVMDTKASSLGNAFASFELSVFWSDTARGLLSAIPSEVQPALRRVLTTLRGSLAATPERRAEFLAAVRQSPSIENIGLEMWRLGLIPDAGGEDCVDRLERNQRCVRELSRPIRANSSAEERIEALRLADPSFAAELKQFFKGRRLRDARRWLESLAAPEFRGRLTFENWKSEEGEESDLQSINVKPLLGETGVVESYTKLRQSEAGAQPVAPVGEKAKVSIKWECTPKGPTNLSRWRAEVVPSREYYGENEVPSVDLPAATASAKVRQATIPLNVELSEETPAVAVQVRIVALDANGAELANADGNVEGLSEEFWLTREEIGDETRSEKDKQATMLTLPLGRLKAASELNAVELDEAPGQWNERDLHYFSIRFNGRFLVKLGLSSVLRAVEQVALSNPADLGCYSMEKESGEVIDVPVDLRTSSLDEVKVSEEGKRFLERRKEFFNSIFRQEHRGVIEVADWNDDVCRKARSYANAYLSLVSSLKSSGRLRPALRVDTLSLSLTASSKLESSVIILPTHPLRALWYAAYSELLRSWESELLKLDPRQRKKLLDFDLLSQVAPVNCPAFVLHENGEVYLFTQNLRFFWGVALPVDVQDPAKRIASIASALAIPEQDNMLGDLPPEKLTSEMFTYCDVHPYLESLRLNCINPGSSGFLAEVLRGFYQAKGRTGDDEEEVDDSSLPRLDLVTHVYPPVPTDMPALTELQKGLYELQPRGGRQYFAPFFSVSVRPIADASRIPGGEVNLSMIFDTLAPQISTSPYASGMGSASLYGLLMRMQPEFEATEQRVAWRHRFSVPDPNQTAKHPVSSSYTGSLLELHRSFLAGIAQLICPGGENSFPVVEVTISQEARDELNLIHEQSDWVITLDRFFDVEFFDAPRQERLSDISRKYLLDYAPEFLEGLGHRMLVTTTHREEVEQILARAMTDLGFGEVEDSVGKVFDHLKTISGRLALRILGDGARAKEAVSLGVVAAYLKARGELFDSMLVPVDSHPELFGPRRAKRKSEASLRCDLIQLRFVRNRLVAGFIEVKSRSAAGHSDELLNRITDQIESTVEVFQSLFFSDRPQRIDHSLQRTRLATILRFYLRRADRYGLITSPEALTKLEDGITRLETGISELRVERTGYVVNLLGVRQRPTQVGDTEIFFVTAEDVVGAGLSVAGRSRPAPAPGTPPEPSSRSQDGEGRAGPENPPPVASPTAAASQTLSATFAPTESENQVESSRTPTPSRETFQVELGMTPGGQDPVVWKTGVKGSPHLFIVGIPGQGKSWTTTRILMELADQGLPSLVIDFHGQFSDPNGPYVKLTNPLVLNVSHGLPFSPFEADDDSGAGATSWQANCFAVAEIFEYVCELGDIQRDVIYQAIRDCYLEAGFDSGRTAERLPTIDEFRKRLEELEESRGVKNIVPRCRPLLEFGLFSPRADGAEFRELLTRGMVVDVSELGMETLQLASGAFVLRKIYKDMFHWGETRQLRLAIVLDEAHRLARDVTLPKIMKEGRKFGIAVIVASQGITDFHPDVVGNAGTKVIFRTNFPMSKKVAGFVRAKKSVNLSEQIEQLCVGEAFVQTPEMATCTRVQMHPLSRGR